MSNKPLSVQEKVIEVVACTDAALTKADSLISAYEKQAADAKALIPAATEALIKNESVHPDNREKLAAALANPVRVLELLIKVASHRNAAETRLGSPVGGSGTQKSASAAREGLRESDEVYLKALGINID